MAHDQALDAPRTRLRDGRFLLLYRSYERFAGIHGHIYAAAMSYFVLFSLFPWLIFLFTMLAWLVRDPVVQAQIVNQIVDQFPPGARIRLELRAFISEITMRSSGFLGIVGLITTVVIASEAFRSLRYALNALFGVTQKRSFLRGRGIDALGMIVVVTFAFISAGLTTILTGSWIQEQRNPGFGIALVGAVQFVASLLLSFVAFTLMYRVVPEIKLEWRILWIPGLIAALGFELSKVGMGLFLVHFSRFQHLYGALSVTVVMVVFVFLVANVVLLAGALAAEIDKANRTSQHDLQK